MEVKVNIETDWSAGLLTHYAIAPWEGIFVPIVTLSIEVPCMQHWVIYPNHKFADGHGKPGPVLHKNRFICLEGHDCGTLIPDITPLVPLNLWYAFMWPIGAKRKMVFGAGTVQMNGKPTALAQTFNWPVIPMLTCGEPISAPTAFVFTNAGHTVVVHMTWKDLLIGLLNIAINMLIDLIFALIKFKGFGGLGKAYSTTFARGADRVAAAWASEAGQKLAQKAVQAAGQAFVKEGESATAAAGNKVLQSNATREVLGKIGEKVIGVGKDGTAKLGQTMTKWALGGAGDFATSALRGSPQATLNFGGLAKAGYGSDTNAQGNKEFGFGGSSPFSDGGSFHVAAPTSVEPKP